MFSIYGCISLLLSRLYKLLDLFQWHWPGDLGSLDSITEIQPKRAFTYIVQQTYNNTGKKMVHLIFKTCFPHSPEPIAVILIEHSTICVIASIFVI